MGYFRNPKTTNERRQNCPSGLEDDVGPRAKRNHKNVPDSYDDLSNASYRDRNWKRFRKTKYKLNF